MALSRHPVLMAVDPGAGSGEMDGLLSDIRACSICAQALPQGPRPVVRASARSRILIAGQAPGRAVHASGVPFNDPSGDRLRDWLGVTSDQFYDTALFALVPMGFCYPGTGESGDLPPRSECAATWRRPLLDQLGHLELSIVIGRYAIDWHLPRHRGVTVTKAVKAWREIWPDTIVLPHPSPRNNRWVKKNPWFEQEIIPVLKGRVGKLVQS